MRDLIFPKGKKFVFTILDDTDVATVANVKPVYDLLEALGMRATKTVWPVACPEGSENYGTSQTLADPEYLEFVLDLQRRGFEIASHGATMESSPRERTILALDRFREIFGNDPRVYANHGQNRENLYWGVERFDEPFVRALYRRLGGAGESHFQGHDPQSPFWWGDHCRRRITYVRNLTFDDLNIMNKNPDMPYRDPRRPDVQWWFSSSHADNARTFVRSLKRARLDRLESEGGVCILTTHLGKGYSTAGKVDRAVEERLRDIADRKGWFCTVSECLDWLRNRNERETLPATQWRRMQWQYAWDTLREHAESRWRRMIDSR